MNIMGSPIPWVIITIGVLILVLLVVFVFVRKKGKKHEPDYYTFFVMGIIWTFVGLLSKDNSFFFIIGLAFMVISLKHKKDWKKNHRTWKQLNKSEKKLKLILVGGLIIFMVLSLVVLILKGGL